jgi:hypothetical protein
VRTPTAIRNSADNLDELTTEILPERLDIIVACMVTITVVIAVTCLVIVAKR